MKKPPRNIRKMNLREIGRYLSEEDSLHNNPSILAHGSGFIVTTRLGQRDFSPSQLDEAVAYYKLMMEELCYSQVEA